MADPSPAGTALRPNTRVAEPESLFGPGRARWVSMAEALGWGAIDRSVPTVCVGGGPGDGPEPFPSGSRKALVIKELLGHAHIGVTATVYAQVRLRLQRDAIDTLSTALGSPAITTGSGDNDEPPACAIVR